MCINNAVLINIPLFFAAVLLVYLAEFAVVNSVHECRIMFCSILSLLVPLFGCFVVEELFTNFNPDFALIFNFRHLKACGMWPSVLMKATQEKGYGSL